MIAFLKGTVIEIGQEYVVVETSSGVGYKVFVAEYASVRESVELGQALTMYISHTFRENEQRLHGFATAEERNFFELLTTVSGVGPKLASTILASIERRPLIDMIINDDIVGLVAVPGIGKKTAQRLIVELRDKVFGQGSSAETSQHENGIETRADTASESISRALETLGFSARERKTMLIEAERLLKSGSSVEEVLRHVLSHAEL